MTSSRPLTPLADAQAALLSRMAPVAPELVACDASTGLVAAEDVPVSGPQPTRAYALRAGYAMRADDLAGASSFAPAYPARAPVRVDLGDSLPEGCDCVIDAASLDVSGAMPQAFVESYPGENIRRIGEDLAPGATIIGAGRSIDARHALVATCAGVSTVGVRRPRVAVLGKPIALVRFVAMWTEGQGAALVELQDADLVIALGDAPADAEISMQGLALEPGRDCGVGQLGAKPLLLLPHAAAQVVAGLLALVRPALDRLAARTPSTSLSLPLTAKISSRVGLAEVVLLRADKGVFTPLAVGDAPLRALSLATHAALIGAGSEGLAAGDLCTADPFEF